MSAARWTCHAKPGCQVTATSVSSHLAPDGWGWGVDGKPRCPTCHTKERHELYVRVRGERLHHRPLAC